MSKYKLILAEKPSVAQSIAVVLGTKERKDGFLIGNGYIVSWCFGHLVELAQPSTYDECYQKWKYSDLPILPEKWKYVATADKKKQLNILASLMKRTDVDTIINACDAGREGELIFRLVYNYLVSEENPNAKGGVCKANLLSGCKKAIQRLWISSMEESAIKEGFLNLKDGAEYENLYHAALCRSQADWMVGINATRLFSVLYGATLNTGRVQSPILALLVNRDAEISSFVKEPFYTPELNCGDFSVCGEKTKDKDAAENVYKSCNGKDAATKSIAKQEKSVAPPKLFDLTTLQREANRLFGYTAQQTLDYAQALYEKKLVTYPRTDSRYLTEDMAAELPTLVLATAGALPFIQNIGSVEAVQVIDNSKVSDHHGIIPTPTMPKAELSSLPEGERHILYLVATRLICAVSIKHRYAETVVTVDCAGHSFTAKGKAVLENGWKDYEQSFRSAMKQKISDETEKEPVLPNISEGQIFSAVMASVREGFTSPPKRYTEDTLLSAMENTGIEDMPDDAERKGLGTPATRANIIEKLIKSGFVERKSKQLVPTQKGVNLIAVLPETIKSPLLTAEWEHKLKQIEHGKLTADRFMDEIAAMTKGLVQEHVAPNPEYASLFATEQKGEAIGKCPRCGLSVYENTKGFFCESRACGFALWKDAKFFTMKKKKLDKKTASALIKDGRIFMSGLYSEKTGKTYDATILLDDTGKYMNYKLDFTKEAKK